MPCAGSGADDDSDDYIGFEWDEAKSEATFVERGIAFAAAAEVFKGDYLEREDLRRDYGERRFIVTGEVQGVYVSVVWTPRGRRRRIVSTWPASMRERREYREYSDSSEQRERER